MRATSTMAIYGSLTHLKKSYEISLNQALLMKFEKSAGLHAAGNAGGSFVVEAEELVMLDLPEKAHQLLSKAKEWLDYSIAHSEYTKFRPQDNTAEYYQTRFLCNLALCNWLLTNVHDQEKYVSAGKSLKSSIEKKQYRRFPKSEFSEMLLCLLQTGHYQEYFKCHKFLKYQIPVNIAKASSCSSLAYLLCEHLSKGKHDRDALVAQIRKYLKRLVPTDSPYFNLVTLWVKLLHWHLLEERDKTAFELLGQYRQYLRPE